MSLLFKTVLNNIYKNKLYIFILFFFSVGGSTVYLSSENLKDNIDKSLLPFNYPNNSFHDFVISRAGEVMGGVKKSTSDDSFYVQPSFDTSIENIDAYSSLAWKYKMNGNVGNPFTKVVETDKDAPAADTARSYVENELTQRWNRKFNMLSGNGLRIYIDPDVLNCPAAGDFFAAKKITFANHNLVFSKGWKNVDFNNLNVPKGELYDYGQPINIACANFTEHSTIKKYITFLMALKIIFETQSFNKPEHTSNQVKYGNDIFTSTINHWSQDSTISHTSSSNTENTTANTDAATAPQHKAKWTLTPDEKETINSFQYNKTWWIRNLSDSTYKDEKLKTEKRQLTTELYPFVTKDHYINIHVPFSNRLKNQKDIHQKWKELTAKFINNSNYYKISPEIRGLLDKTKKNLDKIGDIDAIYFFGNFEKTFQSNIYLTNLFLPHLPSIPFQQQLFLLHKLLLWKFIDDNLALYKQKDAWSPYIIKPTKKQHFSKQYFADLKKNNYAQLIDLIDKLSQEEHDTPKKDNSITDLGNGITASTITPSEKWAKSHLQVKEDIYEIKNHEKELKKTNLSEYLFSNVPTINQKFNDLKISYANKKQHLKYNKYDKSTNSGGPAINGLTEHTITNASNTTLKDELLDTWKRWIKNENIYTPEDLGLTKNLQKISTTVGDGQTAKTYSAISNKHYIPSQKYINWSPELPSADASATSSQPKIYDTTHSIIPNRFDDVFDNISKHILNEIELYVETEAYKKNTWIKNFFSQNNLFKLSFLVYNFNFDDTQKLNIDQNNKNYKRISELLNDFEINIHKSAVVSNVGNISAKLNDTTTTDHKFKIINKSSQEINQLKIVDGNPLFKAKYNFSNIIEDYMNNDQNYHSSYELGPVLRLMSKAKYNTSGQNTLFKDQAEYVGSPQDRVWEKKIFINEVEWYRLMQALKSFKKSGFNARGSKISFELNSYQLLPTTRTFWTSIPIDLKVFGYIEQPTSYFTVVSSEYARQNGINPISNAEYLNFKNILENPDLTQEDWETAYSKFIIDDKNHNSIINIHDTKLIVVGLGQTPDFLFPSLSWLNLMPNKKKEALVYVDEFGYKNFSQNSVIEFFENYISFKYPSAVSELGLQKHYLKSINNFMTEYTGDEVFDISQASDPAIQADLFSIRSKYAHEFKKYISWFANILMLAIFSIIFIIIYILSKKYIQKNINIFGNFVANGTPKIQIIATTCLFVLVPIFFATFGGIFISLFTQPFIYQLVSSFWFLPVQFNTFSIFQLIYSTLKFIAWSGIISAVASALVMRPNVSVLIKENAIFKQSKWTNKIYSLLSNTSALWKFRCIIIFNAISQTVILTTASIIVYLLFSFLWHNNGKIQAVSQAELRTRLNGFGLNFFSPTSQSGQYHLTSYYDAGKTFVNNVETKHDLVYGKPGDLKKATMTTSKDNPELVMANINNTYHSEDFEPFVKCLDHLVSTKDSAGEAFAEFNKSHLKISPSTLYRLLFNKENDHYLHRSYIEAKSSKTIVANSNDCIKLTSDYESKWGTSKVLSDIKTQVFGYSKTQHLTHARDAKNSRSEFTEEQSFNPEIYIDKKYNFATYIPVENEHWDGGEQGKVASNTTPQSSSSTSSVSAENPKTKIEMYGEEPLFNNLHTLYYEGTQKEPVLPTFVNEESVDGKSIKSWYVSKLDQESSKTDSSINASINNESITAAGDFWYYKDSKGKGKFLPNLNRLSKDNANYWTINISDFYRNKFDPKFFQNQIITRILLDHDLQIPAGDSTIDLNLWNVVFENIKNLRPELATVVEPNHHNFINGIINSKYGKYFIQRFMTAHFLDKKTPPALSTYRPGDKFNKRDSYAVLQKNLDQKHSKHLIEGLYYLDSEKVFYFYNDINNSRTSLSQSEEKGNKHETFSLMYRPDFLYMFFALMNDKEFIKKYKPLKFAFNYSIQNYDYNDITKTAHITGDANKDKDQGLLAEDATGKYNQQPAGDQTYTFLDGELFKWYDSIPASIIGLKRDSRGTYIELLRDNTPINNLLYDAPQNNEYPIVINQFSAKKFNLQEGSVIKFKPHNTFDRYSKELKNETNHQTHKLKVVGIYDAYFKDAIFISQKNANKILGLSEDYGHNGLFTKDFKNNESPHQFNQIISGYSESGIFTDTSFSKNKNLQNLFDQKPVESKSIIKWQDNVTSLSNAENFELFKTLYELKLSSSNDVANVASNIFGQTSSTAISPLINGVTPNSIQNNFYFSSISDLITQIIYICTFCLTPLLVFSLLIMTNLIIDDLKNLLVVLKLLGFTGGENSVPIIIYLLSILLLTTLLGTAIFAALIKCYIDIVFTNLQILLPIFIQFKYLGYSFSILAGIFSLIIAKSFLNIKNIYMPTAMKLLSD